jgi:transcription elongation factor Elf1
VTAIEVDILPGTPCLGLAATCPRCGGGLRIVTQGAVARTELNAVLACEGNCGWRWQLITHLRPMPRRTGADYTAEYTDANREDVNARRRAADALRRQGVA